MVIHGKSKVRVTFLYALINYEKMDPHQINYEPVDPQQSKKPEPLVH